MAIDKNTLRQVITDQKTYFDMQTDYIKRAIDNTFIQSKKISVITGVRRCGKSTLLKQIASAYSGYYYLNFEDDRLITFTHEDFNTLLETFFEMYGDHKVFFFDEIQNVFGWEKFVRRLFNEGYKVFVTGSNAKLLSSELATALTGRHLSIKLYPFTFMEFLTSKNVTMPKYPTTREKSKINRHLKEYITLGGFPEIVKSKNKEELRQLYQDILINDLIVRFKIKDVRAFKELSLYLLSNTATPMSFNNLKHILGFKSVSTVKNYIDHLEESYINYSIYKYDYSLKKQIINDRKIYGVDTGLVNIVSFGFSKNKGRLIENVVFLELKNRKKDIYYHKNTHECDFVIKKGTHILEALQVTDSIYNKKTREREINGLLEAIQTYGLSRGTIVVFDGTEKTEKINGKKIMFIPLWKWLVEEK
ncbi:ATP-binding protein [Patescibacteria group bacterium]|nr:ATP-binding protein [Patescibacteria group bacterium]